MERMPFSAILALALNGSAVTFAGAYFVLYEQPLIVISLSLSLLSNLLNHYRIDSLEDGFDALRSQCVPEKPSNCK